MFKVLLIGLGGFLGASSRYFLTEIFSKFIFSTSFAYATISVNLIGCLLFGAIVALVTNKLCPTQTGLFLIVGFIGSFTTFSKYSFDSFQLLEQGEILQMLLNIMLQTVLGILFVGFSYTIITKLIHATV